MGGSLIMVTVIRDEDIVRKRKAKVLESNANNSTMFMQREILGTDVYSVVNQFVKKVLISENVVKQY